MPLILDGADDTTTDAGLAAPAAWREGALEVLDAISRDFADGGHALAAQQMIRELRNVLEGRAVVIRLEANAPGHATGDATRLLLRQVVRVVADLDAERQETAISKLAELILPDPLADARAPLALDNLALRDRFVAETAPLTSTQVSEAFGYAGSNPYATAARWKKAGLIFSVHHRGTEYFPAFQFRDGEPHPAIKPLLRALPASQSPWQRAFWFVSTNGWLGDRAPVEVIDDLEAVLAAAKQEGQEVMG